ncbi:hypothetical protein ACP70R_026020 [Stipagrostis hirtigluma subsp. patula]
MAHDPVHTVAGEHDRLSELPDDVLLNILRRLADAGDVRTVARTSILSRRWRPLPWPQLTNIYLDVGSFITQSDEWTPARRRRQRRFGEHHHATAGLRLKFILTRRDHVRRIGELVGAAASTGAARAVELEIVTELECASFADARTMLGYGERFMDFLAVDCPGAFRSLTKLTLSCLWFTDPAVLNNLVRGCDALEFLSLAFRGFLMEPVAEVDDARLAKVTIDAPQSRLKTLLCIECLLAFVDLVRAPAMAAFHYAWWFDCPRRFPPVRFGSTPSLKGLTLCHGQQQDVKWKLSELLENAGQLEWLDLRLGVSIGEIWVEPEHPKELGTALSGLKELRLVDIAPNCDLSWALFLLEAAPLLESLDIHIYNHICRAEWRKKHGGNMILEQQPSSDFVHHNLKKLSFHRAFDLCKDLPFARLVMELAVSLETITLGVKSLTLKCEECRATESEFPDLARSRLRSTTGNNEEYVDALAKKLKDGISTSAQITILLAD